MMKRILSFLLAFLMVVSIFPAPTYATDSTDATITPTETPTDAATEAACPTCGTVDCTSDHTNWCADCKKDNCGQTHVFCETCKKNDCGVDHTAELLHIPMTSTGQKTTETQSPDYSEDVGKYVKLNEAIVEFTVYGLTPSTGTLDEQIFMHADFLTDSIFQIAEWMMKDGKVWYRLTFYKGGLDNNSTFAQNFPAEPWFMQTAANELVFVDTCTVCGKPDCSGHTWCDICEEYDCGKDHTQPPVEPENPCDCCDSCTGAKGCTCECGACDFCEKTEEPTVPSISTIVNGQTVTVNGTLPQGVDMNLSASRKESGVTNTIEYDIELALNGESYEPESAVSVTISGIDVVPGGFVKVIHFLEDLEAIKHGYGNGTVQIWTDSSIASAYPAAAAAAQEALGMADTVCVEQFYSTENEVSVGNGTISFAATSFSIYTVTYTGTDAGRAYAVYDDDNGTAQNSNGYSETHEITMDDSNGQTFMLTRGQKFYLDIGPTFFKTGMTSYQWYLSESSIGSMDTSGFGTLAGNDTVLTVSTNAPLYKHYTITLVGYNLWGNEKDRRYINVYVVPEVQLIFYPNIPSGATSSNVTMPSSRKTVLGDGSTAVKYTRVQVSNPSGTVTGYTFDGWYTAATGGEKVSSGSYIFLDNDNAELVSGGYSDQYQEKLYAQWKANDYTVTFNANGGSGGPGSQTKYHGENLTLSSTIPTRTGYTFFGWHSSADNVVYQAGATYSANQATVMTAMWGKQSSATSGWNKNFYILPGTTSHNFADALKYIDKDKISQDGSKNNITGDNNTYYVAPGATVALAHDSGMWRIDGAKTGLTLKAGSATANASSWTAAATDATLTVSATAAEGTTMMIYVRDATAPAEVSCARIIVDKVSDITAAATNDTQGIYRLGLFVLCDSSKIPGEPNYTINVDMVSYQNKGMDYTNYKSLASASVMIAPAIGTSAHYESSMDGSCTMGIVDYEGFETVEHMSPQLISDAMDTVIYGITHGSTMIAADGINLNDYYTQHGEQAVRDNFSVRPYVVKLMTGLSSIDLGWHVDLAVYAKNTVMVNYNLNTPQGYVLKTQGTPAPGIGQSLTGDVSLTVTNEIPVNKQCTATVTGATDQASLTFKGWNTKPDGTGTSYAPGSTISLSESVTLYAQWDGGSFTTGTLEIHKRVKVAANSQQPSAGDTFTFSVNLTGSWPYTVYNETTGAQLRTGTMTNGTVTLKAGEFVRFTNVPIGSYTVRETNLPADYTPDKTSYTVDLKGGYVNQAIFTNIYDKPLTYAVIGTIGDGGSVMNGKQTVAHGQSSTAMTFTPAVGYKITGVTVNGQAQTDFGESSYTYPAQTVTGSIQVNVTTAKKNFTVTYMVDGIQYGDIDRVDYDAEVTVRGEPTKAGYIFSGWTVTGVTATDGKFNMPAGNVTISGSFTVNTYEVEFNANNGSGTMDNQSFTYDVAQALTANVFTRADYIFAGWNTKADGTGTAYTDKQSVKNLVESGRITLYAQWMINKYTVTGTIDHGGKVTNTPQSVEYGEANLAMVFTPAQGYEISGVSVNGEPVATFDPSSYSFCQTITKDTTVEVTTSCVVYTITYDMQGGVLDTQKTNPKNYTVETETFTLNNPTKPGYKFLGWATSENATSGTETVTIEKGTTGNKTFYAVWERSLVDLTIKTRNSIDTEQSYIFTVTGQTVDHREVKLTVVLGANDKQTIVNLPAGVYTIQDQQGWSWRYDSQSKDAPVYTNVVVDFNYTYEKMIDTKIYWLNGYGNEKIKQDTKKRKD